MYLITDKYGDHFIIKKYTQEEYKEMCEGLITIIRLSDGKILDDNNQWLDLPYYLEY